MALVWTEDQKEIAKRDRKALVKLQVQLKHCGGGNYEVVGPFKEDHALALFLLGALRSHDEKIQQVLALLRPEIEQEKG